MSFESLLIHTVTVSTPTVPDPNITNRYGDPVESATVTADVPCRVQPAGGGEELENRETRVTKFRVFFGPAVAVFGTSTLTWLGRTLVVTAEPENFYDGDDLHHLEVDAEERLG